MPDHLIPDHPMHAALPLPIFFSLVKRGDEPLSCPWSRECEPQPQPQPQPLPLDTLAQVAAVTLVLAHVAWADE